MKITKRQLRRIIKEEIKRRLILEADTEVHARDHDPITVEIPALEALATKKNFHGKKVWFDQYNVGRYWNSLFQVLSNQYCKLEGVLS